MFTSYEQVLKKQYPQNQYEMKPLKRFKFPSSKYISIHFDRKLPGGWQLALETSEKVNHELLQSASGEQNFSIRCSISKL